MSILIFCILVFIVAVLFWVAVDQIEQVPPPFKGLIKALILVCAAVAIMAKAGMIS